MNTWQRALDQIGGHYAVTFRAWLITLPASVLVSSVYVTPPSLRDVVEWTTALIAIHLVLGVIMLLAGLTFLSSRPRPPRPGLAIGLFALLGLTRAVLLQAAQEFLGLGFFSLEERVVFNIAASVAIFSAIAIVSDEFAVDSAITTKLEAAHRSLRRLRDEERSFLESLDTQILADVQDRVLHELQKQGTDSTRIREISDSVVRAVSHELTEPSKISEFSSTLAEPDRHGWISLQVARRMTVPSPLAVVGIYQALVFGTVIARLNLGFALLNLLGTLPTLMGLWLMRQCLPLPHRALSRLATLTIGFAIVGILAGIINAWMWREWFSSDSVSIAAVTTGVVVLSLLLSAWKAVVEGRASRRRALTAATNEQAQEVSDLQRLIKERRTSAARFLHGNVQNQLVVSSIRGDSAEEASRIVAELFTEYQRSAVSPNAQEAIGSLVASWSAVLNVELTVDGEVWELVANEPSRSALLTHVISEGLTNTIKHSSSNSLKIALAIDDDAVAVHMSSIGAPDGRTTSGMGLRDIQARGADVDLLVGDDVTTLVARI